MRCSLSLLVPLMILAAPAAGLAQSPKYNVGTPLSQEEIKSFDFMIGPQGQQLPRARYRKGRRGDLCEAVRGLPREEWRKRGAAASGIGQARQPLSRTFQRYGKGQCSL